uniref:Uncharacterized protein n=1 Tax=Oryza glumipatula TaxID=40148 RepID=A0A0D9Y7L0_9ORYZ
MHASGWLHEEYAPRSSSLVAQSCIGSNAAPTKIDFSSMDPALLGTGRWVQVRDQVDLLITDNCALPTAHAGAPCQHVRQSTIASRSPSTATSAGLPNLDAYESFAVIDGLKPKNVRAFVDLVFARQLLVSNQSLTPHPQSPLIKSCSRFCQFSTTKRIVNLDSGRGGAADDPGRVCGGEAPRGTEQNEVNGNGMQTRDEEWVLVKPLLTSLIIMSPPWRGGDEGK